MSVCLVFLTAVFTVSCGLDVISIVLDDFVVDTIQKPEETSLYDSCNFNFTTRKLDNSNDLGHGYVYYKVYNKLTTIQSETTSLSVLTEDSAKKNTSFSRLNDYGFKELMVKKGSNVSIFQLSNEIHNVDIRLTNYAQSDSGTSFDAHITVDSVVEGIPLRTNDKPFDFGRDTGNGKPVPVSQDEDTKGFAATGDEPDIFYVSLYSVFMMYDDNYEPVYSPVHYLGTVKIDAGEENN